MWIEVSIFSHIASVMQIVFQFYTVLGTFYHDILAQDTKHVKMIVQRWSKVRRGLMNLNGIFFDIWISIIPLEPLKDRDVALWHKLSLTSREWPDVSRMFYDASCKF